VTGPSGGGGGSGSNISYSSPLSSFSSGTGSYVATGLSASINKSGGAGDSNILVRLVANGNGGYTSATPLSNPFTTVDTAGLTLGGASASTTGAKIGLFVGGVLYNEYFKISASTLDNVPSFEWLVTGVGTGIHTIDVRGFWLFPGTGGAYQLSNCILILEEK
jgi:hypothetical protein